MEDTNKAVHLFGLLDLLLPEITPVIRQSLIMEIFRWRKVDCLIQMLEKFLRHYGQNY